MTIDNISHIHPGPYSCRLEKYLEQDSKLWRDPKLILWGRGGGDRLVSYDSLMSRSGVAMLVLVDDINLENIAEIGNLTM